MTDTPTIPPATPPDPFDVVGVASDVRRALNQALADRGLDYANPDVRRAIVEAITDRPPDRRLTAAEKRIACLDLRKAGASYREIARVVGYAGPGAAYKAVMTALGHLEREPAEAVRQIAVERLDGILAGGLYRRAVEGDMKAVDRVLRVMREARRYLPGVEVPAHAEITGGGGGSIVVEFHGMPEPEPVEPIAQGELGGLDLAHVRAAIETSSRAAAERDDLDDDP